MDSTIGTLVAVVIGGGIGFVGQYLVADKQLKSETADKNFERRKADLEQRLQVLSSLRQTCDYLLTEKRDYESPSFDKLVPQKKALVQEVYTKLASTPWGFPKALRASEATLRQSARDLDVGYSDWKEAESGGPGDKHSFRLELVGILAVLLKCVTQIRTDSEAEIDRLADQYNALMEQGITTPAWFSWWSKMQPRNKVFLVLFTGIAIAAAAFIWWNALK